jgi:predicted hotdog family 3-hydroxylacyl-ACP dehydratase
VTVLDIDALVPHRRPMRLIDEILAIEDDAATTAAVVTRDWPTFAAGAAHALLMIELVAQTAAVVGGYKALTTPSGRPARKGMLVGIKRAAFQVDRLPRGTRLVTWAETRTMLENFKEINGIVKIDDRIVGQVSLQGVQTA